jgi:hypothetical protein
MPRAGTLLCELGCRLEFMRVIRNAVVGLMLSVDQVSGRMLLDS